MKKLILIAFIAILITLSLGLTNPELADLLRLKTDQVRTLNKKLEDMSFELSKLKLDYVEIQRERKEDKIVIDTVDVLTKGGTASRWANPAHIKYVVSVCKKYEYIVKDIKEKEKLACWQFVFARLLATGLDPNFKCDRDANGHWDYGIADLNDICLESIQKDLPEHLKKANWYNIEKSIAGLYVWIKQRKESRMSWAELAYFQWMLYAKIKD